MHVAHVWCEHEEKIGLDPDVNKCLEQIELPVELYTRLTVSVL